MNDCRSPDWRSPDWRSPDRRAQGTERGSAFLLALIIIVLLTILGVSIVLVTETENLLGHAEKTIDRQMLAAETGLTAQLTGLVVAGTWCKERIAIPIEPDSGNPIPGRQLAYTAHTTKPLTLASGCPAWTDCGEDLAESNRFLMHFVSVAATAQRVAVATTTVFDPDDPTTFVSPFRASAGPRDHAEDIRFNYKPGVDVLGEASLSVGFMAGPMLGTPDAPRNECESWAAESNSGHKTGPPPTGP